MTAVPTPLRPRPAVGWRSSRAALAVAVAGRAALATLTLLLLVSVLPAVVGWQSTVVLSGSMRPALAPGDVAVVRPVPTADLQPGQVLLVDDPDLPGRLRLHRLVEVEAGGLRLRGDANPTADSSLVDPSAVHGVGAVRLPMIGLPAVWADAGRTAPLAGTSAALAVLIGLALLYRRPDDQPGAGDTGGHGGPRRRRSARRGTALAAVLLAAVALPGAAARFTGSTSSPSVTIPMALWWTCPDASLSTGAKAARYYALQDQARRSRAADNTGSLGAAAAGTFSATGVTYQAAGPACGTGFDRAVTFDGSSGSMWTTQAVTNPQTFSVQAWFRTSTTLGGKLIGFGNGTDGAASTQYDRHVYMTNAGKLAFGVYSGAYYTVTTPGIYNDGRWHLVSATFSPSTGMRLYVDRGLVVTGPAPAAQNTTGYWRIGYDVVHAAWPGAPQTGWFAGSMAHVGIFDSVLSAEQVAAQYDVGT
jgi:signal peptidase I